LQVFITPVSIYCSTLTMALRISTAVRSGFWDAASNWAIATSGYRKYGAYLLRTTHAPAEAGNRWWLLLRLRSPRSPCPPVSKALAACSCVDEISNHHTHVRWLVEAVIHELPLKVAPHLNLGQALKVSTTLTWSVYSWVPAPPPPLGLTTQCHTDRGC